MFELIIKQLEIMAKLNWLKLIYKAFNKYKRMDQKAKMQAYVVEMLVERYNEIYPCDRIKVTYKGGNAGD